MEVEINMDLEAKYTISHLISANKLKAYVRIDLLDKEAVISSDDILSYIKEQSIVYGIREQEIKEYCEKREFSKELLAAAGLPPIDGEDSRIIFDMDISREKKFLEKEDGSIDFRSINNIISVEKDSLICHILPAAEGEDGINVYGDVVPYTPGRSVSFNNGKNTYISEDGLRLHSEVDGCIKIINEKLFVEDVYTVDNVDNKTGNINFNGSVVIRGDVKAGFTVRSRGDIKIRGMVEGAHIETDGDVIIAKGMNGMGEGSIVAGGNITSKYIENSIIIADGSVFAEALINSDVKAKESIILRGQAGAIIGGTSTASKVIYAKTIGNKTNSETNLNIDISEYMEQQKLYAKKRNQRFQTELTISNKTREIRDIEDTLTVMFGNNQPKDTLYRQLILKKASLNGEINELKSSLIEDEPTDDITSHKIVCKGIMYPNTKITIGWMKYRVRQETSYSKVYNDGNDITFVTLNPADIDTEV